MMLLSQRLLYTQDPSSGERFHSHFSIHYIDVCVYDSVEVVELTPEIEGTFTTSDDVVKSTPTQTTPPAGEHSYTAT